MRREHLELLVCPRTRGRLTLHVRTEVGGRVREGSLVHEESGREYPIVDFIPRFVSSDNYARSFGFEWGVHARTQYDEHSGFPISRERFFRETKWPADLSGELILEVGSGSGRFTRHAVETGATVASLDYSPAVDANYRSNGHHENLLLVQASVYEMPFHANFFDRAFCFGVLQHTPDPRRALVGIVEHLKPGGHVASDIYVKDVRHWLLHTKYYVRPFTRGRNPERLYRGVRAYVNLMWPITRLLRRLPKLGRAINWRLLIADHAETLPGADDAVLREWAYLDVFDMLAPIHDNPQTLKTFRRWHIEIGLVDVEVGHGYNGLEGRGRKRECVSEPR